jgi:enoyl-[acyl-carrier protein] reductase III
MALFTDNVVLVTGSSRGIGAAIARAFAREGADVAMNYRSAGGSSEAKARELVAELQGQGRRAEAFRADIADRPAVHAMVEAVRETFGRLDTLVLNAARAPFKPLEKLLEREIRQLVDTNYVGHLLCLKEALPLLEAARGSIVFISSLGSRFYNPSYPLGSMKAAMEAVVRDCGESLAPRGVRVNAVSGGIVKTDSYKTLRMVWEGLDRIPDDLCVEPAEIADAVLFLCSPAARAVRGQTLVVDRGLGNRLLR